MKTVVVCLMIMLSALVNGQSLSLRFGRNLTPSDHLSLRYEHWTNGAVNLSLGGFMERSRKSNLNLSAYGVDLLAEYTTNREGYQTGAFGLRYGLGATWQIESEPWIYKDWPFKKRMNYGLFGELSGEWFMTKHFTLRVTTQQKILFNPDLGRYRFLSGLGLVYRLSSL